MKVYFKGFNELRAIGALTVIFGHLELLKSFEGIPNLMHLGFYKYTNGHVGVLLFFVLSGFLITYFLLCELKQENKINIKIFYIKRLLRIWPLYYVMVLISLFISPKIINFLEGENINYTIQETKYYLLFLPNIAKNLGVQIHGASHLWSIGMEEQFYLIWPILLFLFRKNIALLLISIFIIFSLLNPFTDYLSYHYVIFKHNPELKVFLNSFFSSFKINAMALGGIFAYIFFNKDNLRVNTFICNKYLEIITVIFVVFSWFFGLHYGTFNDEIYCLLFGVIIYNVGTNKNSKINLVNNTLNYLGKISYGLYVYHWLIIVILLKVIKQTYFGHILIYNLTLYILSFLFTIIISEISFRYIEKPLMNLKYKLV